MCVVDCTKRGSLKLEDKIKNIIIRWENIMQGNIVVGQSGGPTAVINSSVAGVYNAAKRVGIKKIYGMVHGIISANIKQCFNIIFFHNPKNFFIYIFLSRLCFNKLYSVFRKNTFYFIKSFL